MTQHELAEVAGLYDLPEKIEEELEPGVATALAVNPWGTLLALGRPDSGIIVYDLQTRGLATTWPGSASGAGASNGSAPAGSRVTALLWTASGRALLSGNADGSLTAWDVQSGTVVRHLGPLGGSTGGAAGGAVVRLAWAGQQQRQEANEGLVLVSMAAGPAQLLCLASGQAQPLPVLNLGGDPSSSTNSTAAAPLGQVAIASPDGQLVYAGSRGALLVLRRSDLALLDACKVGKGQQVIGLELHGRRLLVVTADTTARVYRAHRPAEQRTSRHEARRAAAVSGAPHQEAAAAQQSAAAGQQLEPEQWQARSLGEAEAAARAAKQRVANSLFYDDSAAWLTLHLTLTNTQEKQALRCAALSPDGEYFAAVHEGGGRQVMYLWECEAEARVNAVLEGPRDEAVALCWHPSHAPKQLLALGQSGKVYIWAKAFIENWSAFAPEFTELTSNDEYHELEDEFDLNPRAEGAAGPPAEEEESEVDIGSSSNTSQQPAPTAGPAADPLAGVPLLHLPLQLNLLGEAAQEAEAAGGKRAAAQRRQQEQGQEEEEERMDIG
ncbi:Retinoblastoma-binding 5 [Chlorella sorokiniana]|uniref:Retinoblastoma-binding 5 n=1 Tax=Chlorella sorokiniana TaxID=3076 RepID=A0A2P6TGH5_CHLSO|nr:Retinoblastoma-binding 5 [Chlorella sorokiniana]|eukprot:PRW33215.1 Retinoblastoma-binding 5 [Chlorella sorokiniana]